MLHKIFSKLGIYWAKHQYMLRGIDWVWDLRRLGTMSDSPIVFDIGANVGQTTSEILKQFPHAKVHAFEPVRSTFDAYHLRFGATKGIRCNQQAVSKACGQVTVFSSSNSQLSHMVNPAEHQIEESARLETVESISVDAYCAIHGIPHINILKTDTEGHDLSVLQGAAQSLRDGCIDWVLVEVTFDQLDKSHTQFRAVDTFLSQYGMEIHCFYDHYFAEKGRHHVFCNALFVKK